MSDSQTCCRLISIPPDRHFSGKLKPNMIYTDPVKNLFEPWWTDSDLAAETIRGETA